MSFSMFAPTPATLEQVGQGSIWNTAPVAMAEQPSATQGGMLFQSPGMNSAKIQSDWNTYFDTAGAGTVVDVGGGKVTRNADGTATWSDGSRGYTYGRDSNMNEVAANTSLGASWGANYANQPEQVSAPVGKNFSSFQDFQQWEQGFGAKPNFGRLNADYKAPDWLRNMGLSASGSEDQYKRYMLYKNNPQFAADYENIMSGGVSKFATDGSTLVKSDVSAMPVDVAQYYHENPQQLALAEGSNMDPVLYRKVQTGEITIPPGVNKTGWLTDNKWTTSGVVANDNRASYAAADNIGMDGQGAGTYIRPRYNSEGQIVDIDGSIHDPYQGVVQRTPGWNGGSVTPESTGSGGSSGSGTGGTGSGGGSSSSSSGGNWQVDDPQTVEGRMNNLLATDASGNYTNQVIRQAVDRANQAFAARGLLNSSMAAQAGQEAAISKATEIASADAKTYAAAASQNAQQSFTADQNATAFERDLAKLAAQHGYTMDELKAKYGIDQTNTANARDDALQSSYRQQTSQAQMNYTTAVANINNSNMTADQKTSAMQIAADARDAEMAHVNEMFANTPRWRAEWSTAAVRVTEASIATITSQSTLNSIINDPAQPVNIRAAATARLATVRAQGSGSTGATGATGSTAATGILSQVGDNG